jgi:hypothetical protein
MDEHFCPKTKAAIGKKALSLARQYDPSNIEAGTENYGQDIRGYLLRRMRRRGVKFLEFGVKANRWIRDAVSKIAERDGRNKRFPSSKNVPFEPHHKYTLPDTTLEDIEESQFVSAKVREALDEAILAAHPEDQEFLKLIYKLGIKQAEVADRMGRFASVISNKKKAFEKNVLIPLLRQRLGGRLPG